MLDSFIPLKKLDTTVQGITLVIMRKNILMKDNLGWKGLYMLVFPEILKGTVFLDEHQRILKGTRASCQWSAIPTLRYYKESL